MMIIQGMFDAMEEINNKCVNTAVLVPTLCRNKHLEKCLDSLMKNPWAKYVDVYIGVDYPAKDSHWPGYREILKLMENLRTSFQASILLITHNLGVVARTCDTVNVMYMGQIVESCDKVSLFEKPLHPYTLGLLGSLPRIDSRERLTNIKGMVPGLDKVPEGCRFADRCPYTEDACRKQQPALAEAEAGHFVRCRRQYA